MTNCNLNNKDPVQFVLYLSDKTKLISGKDG